MIFQEQVSRFPNHYKWADTFIDAMWQGHWTPNEFNFQSDYHQFKTVLTEQERQIIVNTLSAIGQIEVAVKKFWSRLGDNLPHPSLTDLGLVMAQVEVIHNKAYEKLLDVLGLQGVFQENLKLDVISGRVAYLRKYLDRVYTDDKKQYVYALILFTLFVENVSLFSQFYVILWFNRHKNVLKDTAQQVQYTRIEEQLHGQVGVKIILTIKEEYPELFDSELEQRIMAEAFQAFQAEEKIVDWMVGDYKGAGLDAYTLKNYLKNRMNYSLRQIGIDDLFPVNVENLKETQWMEEELHGNSHVDFFFQRSTDYAKSAHTYDPAEMF